MSNNIQSVNIGSPQCFEGKSPSAISCGRDKAPPPLEKDHEFVDGFIVQRSTKKPTLEERLNNYLWRMALQ